MKYKKTAASVMALAVILSATGCNNHEEEYTEEIKNITEDYLAALAEDDDRTIEDITDDYDYGEDSPMSTRYDHDFVYEIIKTAISRTEITEWGEAEFNDDMTEVQIDATFSYIDLDDFADSFDSIYISEDDYSEALESYDELEETTITLKFVFDEDDEQWLLSKKSADRIMGLFEGGFDALPDPVPVTPDDAEEIFIAALEQMADGNFSNLPFDYYLDDWRVFENMTPRYEGDTAHEPVEEFVSEYIYYILDHDYEIIQTEPYCFMLTGKAPSGDDLYQSMTTDEFITENLTIGLMNSYTGSLSDDDLLYERECLIYDTLSAALSSCSAEDYSIVFYYDIYSSSEKPIFIDGDLIPSPYNGYYEAEHNVGQDQYMDCITAAAGNLYNNGELNEDEYDLLVSLLTPENLGFTTDDSVSPSGHPNQAVGTYEQVPDWCTDGSMVYGYSNPDANGIWMHYSKEPGVLDTVAYYLDDEGLWITVTYPTYDLGPDLTVDWHINGELVVDNKPIPHEDGQTEFEIFLAWDSIPSPGSFYEFRLWENGHSHVLAYVTIYF